MALPEDLLASDGGSSRRTTPSTGEAGNSFRVATRAEADAQDPHQSVQIMHRPDIYNSLQTGTEGPSLSYLESGIDARVRLDACPFGDGVTSKTAANDSQSDPESEDDRAESMTDAATQNSSDHNSLFSLYSAFDYSVVDTDENDSEISERNEDSAILYSDNSDIDNESSSSDNAADYARPSAEAQEPGGGFKGKGSSPSAETWTHDHVPGLSVQTAMSSTITEKDQELQFTTSAGHMTGSIGTQLWCLPEVRSQLADPLRTRVEIDYQEEVLWYRLQSTGIFDEPLTEFASSSALPLLRRFLLDELNTFSRGLAAVSATVQELHTSKSGSEGFNVIVQTASSETTCQIQFIDLQTIGIVWSCVENFQRQVMEESSLQEQSMERCERVTSAVLEHLGFKANTSDSAHGGPSSGVLQRTRLLIQIMAIGLLSYVSSHISRSWWHRFGEDLEVLPIDCAGVNFSCTMNRAQLTCLDRFIGSEVNVFAFHSRMDGSKRYAISTLLSYFVELWGPVEIVPTHEDGTASQINTLGGVIRAYRQTSNDETKGKILCHWASDGDVNGHIAEDATSEGLDKPSQDPEGSLKITAVDFDPAAELLIDAGGRAFKINRACQPERQPNCGDNPKWECVSTGTRDRKIDHTGTSYSAGLSKTPVTITGTRTFTITPAVNAKNALLNHFCSPVEQQGEEFPAEDLDQTVGLQISRCTLNARRVSFWEILQDQNVRKYIDDLPSGRVLRNEYESHPMLPRWYEFQHCVEWRNQVMSQPWLLGCNMLFHSMTSIIRTVMSRLADTGPKDKGRIKAWDVEGRSVSWIFESRWAGFFRDGQNNAVFAYVSPTCLDYKHSSSCFVRTKKQGIPSVLTRITIRISVICDGIPLSGRALAAEAQDRNVKHHDHRSYDGDFQSARIERARLAKQHTLLSSLRESISDAPALTEGLTRPAQIQTPHGQGVIGENGSPTYPSRNHGHSADMVTELTRRLGKHPSDWPVNNYAWDMAHGTLILDPMHEEQNLRFSSNKTYRRHPFRSIWKTNTATSVVARHIQSAITGLQVTNSSSDDPKVKLTYMEATRPTYKQENDIFQTTKYVCILDMDDFDSERLRKCESEPYMRLKDKRAHRSSAAHNKHQAEDIMTVHEPKITTDKGKAREDDGTPIA